MRTLCAIVWVAMALHSASAQQGWRDLFDGKSLNGWSRINGTAEFVVEEGAIMSRSIAGSPNSFLCTQEEFGDFVLEFEAKAESTVNSGVQIRGQSLPEYKAGRVHGYQVDIDASDRRWTGGIYDESRRGWLQTLDGQKRSREAFTIGAWNTFRVEAFGPSLRTWVNGVPCADILDDETPRGFIGLQVHAIGKDSPPGGAKVWWRKMRILTIHPEKERSPETGDIPQYNYLPNTLSQREVKEGWKLLWDGKTTAGWRGAKGDVFPPSGWTITNGELTVRESGGGESRDGGDIVTDRQYADFELIVEFRITRGANSGIKYFVNTELNKGEGSAIGPEFQILDDDVHPDAKLGVNGNRKLAGLYDLIPPVGVRFNGVGEWNRARIVAQGAHVEHWLNGFKTVSYDRGTQMWRALVDHSKYVVWNHFGEARQGDILLQDHGNRVSFRSIKLRELPAAARP